MALQFTRLERSMERVRRRRDAETWRGIFERFGASGLTVRAFCRAESLDDTSFYRWRARLSAVADSGKAPIRAVRRDDAGSGFVDLGPLTQTRAPTSRLELKLDLGGGMLLHLVRS